MSVLFSDTVSITPVVTDQNYGTETEGTAFTSKAYIENDTEIRYGSNGQPIYPAMMIFLPKETSIKEGDYIEITQLHGSTPTTQEARKRKARSVSRVGAFSMSHIEVTV